jgi:hypothetical protein
MSSHYFISFSSTLVAVDIHECHRVAKKESAHKGNPGSTQDYEKCLAASFGFYLAVIVSVWNECVLHTFFLDDDH